MFNVWTLITGSYPVQREVVPGKPDQQLSPGVGGDTCHFLPSNFLVYLCKPLLMVGNMLWGVGVSFFKEDHAPAWFTVPMPLGNVFELNAKTRTVHCKTYNTRTLLSRCQFAGPWQISHGCKGVGLIWHTLDTLDSWRTYRCHSV